MKQKIAILLTLGSFVIVLGILLFKPEEKPQPVFKEELPVLKMTHEVKETPKTAIKPFLIEAIKMKEYYDGQDHDVESITKFEGVYRSNQGIDYTYQDQKFDVVASLDGIVKEIKDDPILGKSVTIVSDQIEITYQSLNEILVKEQQQVKQKTKIATAGENIYDRDIGNHLHYVVSVKGKIVDPESIYGKSVEEIVK